MDFRTQRIKSHSARTGVWGCYFKVEELHNAALRLAVLDFMLF